VSASSTEPLTFFFTDIEGSTKLWEKHPDAMRVALARHDAILRDAIESNDGAVFKTIGDAFCAVFPAGSNGLAAAVEAQRALQSHTWDGIETLRVRMALHTGPAEHRNGDYYGPTLNRVARFLSAGHGGQILLSQPTREQIEGTLPPGADLLDLGEHRLKDLAGPEQIFQLVYPDIASDFPPLRSLEAFANNLPIQMTRFIGREREIAEVKARLGKARLLTLMGAGGCGKDAPGGAGGGGPGGRVRERRLAGRDGAPGRAGPGPPDRRLGAGRARGAGPPARSTPWSSSCGPRTCCCCSTTAST
jgi:class 3 adenylate cyclase